VQFILSEATKDLAPMSAALVGTRSFAVSAAQDDRAAAPLASVLIMHFNHKSEGYCRHPERRGPGREERAEKDNQRATPPSGPSTHARDDGKNALR